MGVSISLNYQANEATCPFCDKKMVISRRQYHNWSKRGRGVNNMANVWRHVLCCSKRKLERPGYSVTEDTDGQG